MNTLLSNVSIMGMDRTSTATAAMATAVSESATGKENEVMMNIDGMDEVLAALQATKVTDDAYLRKEDIMGILNTHFGCSYTKTRLKKIKREELVSVLVNKINGASEPETVPVGDLPITRDTAPIMDEEKEENTMEKETMAATNESRGLQHYISLGTTPDRLKEYVMGKPVYKKDADGNDILDKSGNKVVKYAINGIAHYLMDNAKKDESYGNYINNFILTSIISEQCFGRPLMDRKTRTLNAFSDNEKKVIQGIREAVVQKLTRFTYRDASKKPMGYRVTSYVLYKSYNKNTKLVFSYKDKATGQESLVYVLNDKVYANGAIKDWSYGISLWLDQNAIFKGFGTKTAQPYHSSCPF